MHAAAHGLQGPARADQSVPSCASLHDPRYLVALPWFHDELQYNTETRCTTRVAPHGPEGMPSLAKFYQGASGDLRNIVALLLFLNRTSNITLATDVPHGEAFIKHKLRPLLSHRVIKIKLDPMPRLMRLCAGSAFDYHALEAFLEEKGYVLWGEGDSSLARECFDGYSDCQRAVRDACNGSVGCSETCSVAQLTSWLRRRWWIWDWRSLRYFVARWTRWVVVSVGNDDLHGCDEFEMDRSSPGNVGYTHPP